VSANPVWDWDQMNVAMKDVKTSVTRIMSRQADLLSALEEVSETLEEHPDLKWARVLKEIVDRTLEEA
jgi:hypothetical protein